MSIIPIALLAFALRALPRAGMKDAISSDGYFHLALARMIRKNRHHIPKSIHRLVLPNTYTYPWFFHWLLSFVPAKHLLLVERYVSPILDAIAVILVWFLSKRILIAASYTESAGTFACWASLLFCLSPAFLRVAAGPRAYHGTPRTLGQLFFLCFMGFLILYKLDSQPQWLAVSITSAALLSVTSKFGNQAIIFISFLLLCLGEPVPALAATGGYLLSILVTRGRVLEIFHGQIRHSTFYFRHIQKKYLYPFHVTAPRYLGNLFAALRLWKSFPTWFFSERFLPHLLVTAFPHLLLAAVLVGIQWQRQSAFPADSTLIFPLGKWVLASFAVSLVISVKPFLFLGAAERYLENTVFPQILLFVVLCRNQPLLLQAVLIFSVISYLMSLIQFRKVYAYWRRVKRDLIPLAASFDEKDKRFYAIGTSFWPLLFATEKARVLSYSGNLDESILPRDTYLLVFGNHPYPGRPVAELVRRFQIDYLVGNDASFQAYEKLLNDPCFTNGTMPLLDQRGEFRVYGTGKQTQAQKGSY